MDDRQIVLRNSAPFPKPAQFERCILVLGHQDYTAGFAIEPIDQVWSDGVNSKVKANAADETRVRVAFRRMTDEVCRFVKDQQLIIFVDDVEKFGHVERLKRGQLGRVTKSTRFTNSSLHIQPHPCASFVSSRSAAVAKPSRSGSERFDASG